MSEHASARVLEVSRLPLSGLALLAGLSVVWGLNWPVMKVVLAEVPVWWFRAACVSIGGLGLLTAAALSGGRVLPSPRDIGPLLLCAVFSIVGWHLLTAYGISLMPAGRASIIAYTMPLWAALFGALILREAITAPKVVGQIFGLAGLAFLMGPDVLALERAPIGALFMLTAAISWGLGTVLFKRTAWSTPIAATTGWMSLAGVLPITIGALLLEEPPDLAGLKTETWAAMGYVFFLGLVFGQWAFFRIVHMFPASVAAMSTLAVPVVGVISSTLMLGETVGTTDLIALALIAAALFSVLVVPALQRRAA